MDKSYRKAAKSISELTGQSISHGGAWNLVQRSGKLVREEEKRLVELRQAEVVSGEIESRVLFEPKFRPGLSTYTMKANRFNKFSHCLVYACM